MKLICLFDDKNYVISSQMAAYIYPLYKYTGENIEHYLQTPLGLLWLNLSN